MGIKKVELSEGEKFSFEKHINEFLIKREDAQLSEVFTVVVPINKSTHDQIHNDMEQIFIVIQGNGIIETHKEKSKKKEIVKIEKNDIVLIQLNTYHKIINTNPNQDLKYICVNAFLKEKETEFTSISHADNVIENYDMQKSNLNERPVLLIGAGGFIGKGLIEELENIGKYVWAFDIKDIMIHTNRTLKVIVKDEKELETKIIEMCQKYNTCPEILIDATGNNNIKKHSFNLSVEEFSKQLTDNLVNVYNHVSIYAKQCNNHNCTGKIVLLGSVGAQMSHREMLGYDAAKGGLESMVRGLALDYAPYNININLIAVGPIEDSPSSNTDNEKTIKLRQLLPIGKYPSLKEVAQFIVNFSIDLPLCVTGQRIAIDGGLSSQLRPVYIENLAEPKMYKLGE